MASFTSNGASVLYHNNTAAVTTTASGGASIAQNLAVTGTSTLTGAVTAAAGLTVDNLTIVNGGNEIDVSSGDLYLDVEGDIILDANGADINLYDDGTQFGKITNASTNISFYSGSTLNTTMDGANITFAGTVASGAITSSGDVTAFSDMNLKTDIRPIDNPLSKVCDLRGVYFTKDGEAGTGVIAQEVENILPEVVKDGEYKSVAYGNMVGILIEAIKELKAEVEKLKESK